MNEFAYRDGRTAAAGQSIWQIVPEDTFREHLVGLEECTNAVPIDPQSFPITDEHEANQPAWAGPPRTLPVRVEQDFADDLASLVAVQEGAQSVAAVCLEEHVTHDGMTIRVAAIDIVNNTLRDAICQVIGILRTSATSPTNNELTHLDTLFELVIKLHFSRILGRLRSRKWQKPAFLSRSHKKPLWQDFKNLVHRADLLYSKKEKGERHAVVIQLNSLEAVYRSFDETDVDSVCEDEAAIQNLVKASYAFCTSSVVRGYARRLKTLSATRQVVSAIKSLHQIEKIAAHKRVSKSLIKYTRLYPELFHNIVLEYTTPYLPVKTSIGYESWATSSHVHAEVQMAIYYDVELTNKRQTDILLPRCIGTSKHLCYLCFLFLSRRNLIICSSDDTTSPSELLSSSPRLYPKFHISNTHGRLYDQWTIPDLAESTADTCEKYQAIISGMDDVIRDLSTQIRADISVVHAVSGQSRGNWKKGRKDGELVRWKIEPMTSREDLLMLDDDDNRRE